MVGKHQEAQAGFILFLIIAICLITAPTVAGSNLTFVPPSSGVQWFPAISGNRVVWSDNGSGTMDIYLYDIAKGREMVISNAPSDQYMPKIYGDRVVWMDKRNMVGTSEKWDIYMYDLQLGKEIPICTSPGSHKLPSIWADRIVWQDERNGNSDIYMYDVSAGEERPITTAKGNQMFPSIDGDRIVWLDARENTNFTDIYYYDLTLEKESPVWIHDPNHPVAAGVPAIFGDRIVWDINQEDGNAYLYQYRIASGQTSILVEEPGTKTNRSSIYRVAIYGNWIAYALYKDGVREVKVFDLSSGQSILPVHSELGQDSPAIWGNTLVWQDKSANRDKIAYTKLVPGNPPTAPFFDIEDHWSAPWVESLAKAGLIRGMDDGTFRPDSYLTRAQFAQMLTNTFSSTPIISEQPHGFPDLDPTAWYAQAVGVCTANGWMIGFNDGTFRPEDPLTKAQAITTLARTTQLQEKAGNSPFTDVSGHWSEKYVRSFFLAQPPLLDNQYNHFLAPGGQLGPNQPITRGQASMLLASAIRLPLSPPKAPALPSSSLTPISMSTPTTTATTTPPGTPSLP
jgi:TolB protein